MEITATIYISTWLLPALEEIMEKYDYTQEEAISACVGQFLSDYTIHNNNKK